MQEEADTHIIWDTRDAQSNGYERILVKCWDTEVLLLLIAYMHFPSSFGVWVKAGTRVKPCYFNIKGIKLPQDIRYALLAFHAIS